jgi:hypothetical protein
MKTNVSKIKNDFLLLIFLLVGYNGTLISQDGPYVFYENNQAVVKTINSNGTLTSNTYPNMTGRSVTCFSPELNRSFTVPIKTNLVDEQAVYANTPSKFYAISDFEGEFLIFYTSLIREGVINSEFQWTYGNGHLVVLGDVFSRGNYVNECLWLIYKLEAEAANAGGKVHFILGNHEMFHIMRNDFRYTTQKYFSSAVTLGKEMHELYNNNTELGRWLRTKNIITKLGDYILVHAGISQEVHDRNYSIQYMNEVARTRMRGALDGSCTGDCEVITGSTNGLYWYRGIAEGEVTQNQVNQFLTQLGGKRMIIGHTKGTDIRTMYQGKVILIDQSHQNNWAANFTRALQQDNGCFNRATGRRLSPLTISYERVIATCDVLSNNSSTPTTVNYCTSNGSNTSDEYIGRVQFNTINNQSGAGQGGYSNFTSMSTSIGKGVSYVLTITPTWTGTSYPEGYAAWIDYNQNGIFESTERVWTSSPSTSSQVSGNITIPQTALEGNTRMRISLSYNSIPVACGSIQYGEVEDYSVIITNNSSTPTLNYCTSNGGNTSDEFIGRVQFNTINNQSGAGQGGYSNFTNMSTTLGKGLPYTLTITPTWTGTTYPEGYAAWIDYNQNGTFESTERVWTSSPSTSSQVSGSITIPQSALEGSTRMRISLSYNSIPAACGSIQYGEVEDYTVLISSSTQKSMTMDSQTEPEGNEDKIYLYPNPTNGQILLSDISKVSTLEIYNMLGQKMSLLTVNELLDVSHLNKGIYILKIVFEEGNEQSITFIKE